MGEYAKYGSQDIKIGTCEEMYYLRADQAHAVRHIPGNVDPVRDREALRFRFPWPDEDRVSPGAFKEYERKIGFHDLTMPIDVEHEKVQFTAPGYVISLPCPESPEAKTLPASAFRNGHPGVVCLVQQRWVAGRLVAILACGGCSAKWRAESLEDALPVIEACKRKALNGTAADGEWWTKVADRIEAGYEGLTAHEVGQWKRRAV